jgi:ribonuclease T2
MAKSLIATVIVALLTAAPAIAQRFPGTERIPQNIPQPSGPAVRANEAGKFDYYALVLSWSPSYCAGLQRNDYEPQCHRRDGKRYSFVLHGLWPQFERGYPESCPTRSRPFVPQTTIDRMQDIMPSPRLVIHEYRKHGTCSGLEPNGYFDLSRALFAKITIPQRFQNPAAPFFVSPEDLAKELSAATPGLKPDMMGIVCTGPGDRLKEIRICFTREGEFRACGPNESQRRLCRSNRMFVPPVRVGAGAQ